MRLSPPYLFVQNYAEACPHEYLIRKDSNKTTVSLTQQQQQDNGNATPGLAGILCPPVVHDKMKKDASSKGSNNAAFCPTVALGGGSKSAADSELIVNSEPATNNI